MAISDYLAVYLRDGVAPLATTQTGTDVSASVRSLRLKRGGLTDVGRFAGSTGVLELDNRGGDFSPLNKGGAYWATASSVTELQRWASFIIYYSDPGGTGSPIVWNGFESGTAPELAVMFAESWEVVYPTYNESVTRVHLVDAFGFLGRLELDDSFVAASAADRVDDILDAVGSSGWPSAWRDVDTLATTLLPALDLSDSPRNALELLQDTAAACGGWVWVDQAGRIAFRSRHFWNATNNSDHYAGGHNVPTGGGARMFGDGANLEALAGSVRMGRTRAGFYNGAVVSGALGTVHSTAKQGVNFPSDTLDRTGLETAHDAEVGQLSEWWADANGQVEQWVSEWAFHFYPANAADANYRGTIYALDPGLVVDLAMTAPGEVSRHHPGVVTAVTHTIDGRAGSWIVGVEVHPWEHFTAGLLPARAADGDQCVYFDGSDGADNVTVPHAAAMNITNNLTIQVHFVDWDTAALTADALTDFPTAVSKDAADTARAWHLRVDGSTSSNKLTLFYSPNGTTVRLINFDAAEDYLQTGMWVEVELTVDAGGAGETVEWSVSDDGSTWTLVETDSTSEGDTAINTNTAPIHVGSQASDQHPWIGRIGRVRVYDGSRSGTLVADMDPSEGTPGGASWTGATPSQTWTVNGGAVLEELGVFQLGDRLGTKVLSY